jgi:PAS domain S-box-containing protein
MNEKKSHNLNILFLLEDDQSIIQEAKSIVKDKLAQGYFANDSREAIRTLATGNIDAIVCGVDLPEGRPGLDFLGEIRRYSKVLPFFFYTSVDSQQTMSSAFKSGANDYFVSKDEDTDITLLLDSITVSVEIASMLNSENDQKQESKFARKYNTLFDEVTEGYFIVSSEDQLLTYTNDSFAASLGKKSESLIGKKLKSLMDISEKEWKELSKSLEQEDAVFQMTFRHANGKPISFWTNLKRLEMKGKPAVICQTRDVTRLENLEKEIFSVRNQLKVVVDNSADSILISREDGLIEFLGGSANKLLGISSEDLNFATINDVFRRHTVEIQKIMRQMRPRTRVQRIETQVVTRWGTHVPVLVAITSLPSSDDSTRFLFNIVDMSQQKTIEAERMMIDDLIKLLGTGAPIQEALPAVLKRLTKKISVEFGMVVLVNPDEDKLDIAGVYNGINRGHIQLGAELDFEYLPAEEELWVREGIVRNNLQQHGLHPLETLLYQEGVRAYISLPLMRGDKLIGGVHFGSSKAYGLGKMLVSVFRKISYVISSIVPNEKFDAAEDNQTTFLAASLDEIPGSVLLCDQSEKLTNFNSCAKESLLIDDSSIGKRLRTVLANRYPDIRFPSGWPAGAVGDPVSLKHPDGKISLQLKAISKGKNSVGYICVIAD